MNDNVKIALVTVGILGMAGGLLGALWVAPEPVLNGLAKVLTGVFVICGAAVIAKEIVLGE